MLRMIDKIRACLRGEDGQGLAEYALILVFISIAAIVIMETLGLSINTVFTNVNGALN